MGHRKALAESLAILAQVRAAEGEQSATLSFTMGKTSHMGISSHAENGLPNCEVFPMRTFDCIGYTALAL